MNNKLARRFGFTLVELLVVIGIIGVLVAMLLPALNKARAQAMTVQCLANLNQTGQQMLIYANGNKGWLYPKLVGYNVPPDKRWPVVAFKYPLPNEVVPQARPANDWDPLLVERWTPKFLRCPTDPDANQAHTYIINDHLMVNSIKFSSKIVGGVPTSEVIVLGEKYTAQPDYYMNIGGNGDRSGSDFDRLVDLGRHGRRYHRDPGRMDPNNPAASGPAETATELSARYSNYLFMDMHAASSPSNRKQIKGAVDPWGVQPETQPTGP